MSSQFLIVYLMKKVIQDYVFKQCVIQEETDKNKQREQHIYNVLLYGRPRWLISECSQTNQQIQYEQV